ncbi:hypothetical protein CPB86DRAFT_761714 [Serendipita vermifera]|nr:hypothetical protein CPB86DRAFT_761714 [Serendipita vermifera]
MAKWSDLPNELMVQILWFSDFRMALQTRLLSHFHKELVDNSASLQYLIELGRDDRAPIHVQPLRPIAELLHELLENRRRWSRLSLPLFPQRCPPSDPEFNIYEFCGGYLAYCARGEVQDSICFRYLWNDVNSKDAVNWTPLSVKCAEFSFDRSQDLLVVIEDRSTTFPIHLLSASTGSFHPRALNPIITDLVDIVTNDLDVDITIFDETLLLGFTFGEQKEDLHLLAINWTTSEVMLNTKLYGSSSASLLSSRYVVVARIRIGRPMFSLVDLHRSPVLTLSLTLPDIAISDSCRPETVYFARGSNNALRTDVTKESTPIGETEVLCLVIRLTPSPPQRDRRLLLFISTHRLIQVIKAHDSPQIRVPYKEWTQNGRYVRWLDGSTIRYVSKCGVHRSRFLCEADIRSPIFGPTAPEEPEKGDIVTSRLCLLDFNERMLFWDDKTKTTEWEDEGSIIRKIEDLNSLTIRLGEDVRGGLFYRVTSREVENLVSWATILLDGRGIAVRLLEGFEVYKI